MLPSGRKILAGVAVATLIGCGAPALPPAGPAPGEVDVGYGKQPAEKVTGAVKSVSGEDAKASPPLRLDELLKGKVAGLQIVARPDGSYSFRIRGGTTSMAGQQDQEPLVVIDGSPVASGHLASALAGLTPEDIRQVDVLKDVASTSIYGFRGAAGVIVITTNRR